MKSQSKLTITEEIAIPRRIPRVPQVHYRKDTHPSRQPPRPALPLLPLATTHRITGAPSYFGNHRADQEGSQIPLGFDAASSF